tara:strand:+ start:407 stop:769 length:363 start_codon:yes stop_codon:yes gene_type:complete
MADVNLTLDLRMEVNEQTTHRIRKYGFGDGYEAIAKDGINTRLTEYNVTTEPIKDPFTQTTFIADLDKVATGDYFLVTLTPFSTVPRRYRLKDSTYSRQINPSNKAVTFSFTLVEAYSNA